jgi:hypothetical protein
VAEEKPITKHSVPDKMGGRLGETEITWRGLGWLPFTQVIIWGAFARASKKRKPHKSWIRAGIEGFCQMMVMVGSEWGHNLAHLVASQAIHKPMDEIRIQLGMPRCVYYQLNDPDVTPQEHVARSLGGPIFNLMVFPFAWVARKLTKKDSIVGMTARSAYDTNLLLILVSLLPIPGIDGGSILKWSLVDRGRTLQEADEVVQKVNGPLALLLGLFSSGAFLKKKPLLGLFNLMLGGISLSVYLGWLKEDEISF